ncbi:hypothetical protein JOC25_001990 [Solibacillus kalamii]|uniref:Uncharacterized protein n=1 Tax=Solibacillus kalamii TaxID=1748298 RepID=A0ABX3ZJ15_9BACL|nr:hypothetical protein [Solibacillus kalamii]MBM7665515.1 hypothetical protein [Solibacillus kalamii]OUZ39338.1 hypothetical protein CBM15_08770 [Solibacillus kalamii]
MVDWEKNKGVLGAVVLCGVIWFAHPAQVQVNELEVQISAQYTNANSLLRDTVKELLKWNFSEPITDENEVEFSRLIKAYVDVTSLFFSGDSVHFEWEDKVDDTKIYFMNYADGSLLSEEEATDLYQILNATRYISRDFMDYTKDSEFYDAMHSKNHEMVERVKKRLAEKY